LFRSHTGFILGHGSRIKFWHDVWCGEMTLKEAFLVLYGIARDKDALVVAHMGSESGSLQWDVGFIRAAHDWEVDVLASFFTLLYSIRVRSVGDGKLWWTPSHKGKFVVYSFYKVLTCKEEDPFHWRSIWRTKFPLKVTFFTWSVVLGKMLTLDNLRKRHVIVIDRCYMCKMNGETVDHLLLHCEVARVLWNAIFSRFSLSWVMPLRVVDLFTCWWPSGCSRSAVVWKMIPSCLMWCLWREQNDRNFEDKERMFEELITFFFLFFVHLDYCVPSSLSDLLS
jgi:hypothetical protein